MTNIIKISRDFEELARENEAVKSTNATNQTVLEPRKVYGNLGPATRTHAFTVANRLHPQTHTITNRSGAARERDACDTSIASTSLDFIVVLLLFLPIVKSHQYVQSLLVSKYIIHAWSTWINVDVKIRFVPFLDIFEHIYTLYIFLSCYFRFYDFYDLWSDVRNIMRLEFVGNKLLHIYIICTSLNTLYTVNSSRTKRQCYKQISF